MTPTADSAAYKTTETAGRALRWGKDGGNPKPIGSDVVVRADSSADSPKHQTLGRKHTTGGLLPHLGPANSKTAEVALMGMVALVLAVAVVICAAVLFEEHQRIRQTSWSLTLWWERRQERQFRERSPFTLL